MADHNIYIRYVGAGTGTNQASSPTTPWSLSSASENASGGANDNVNGGGGFSPSSVIKRGANYLMHPGSMVSDIFNTTIGRVGLAVGAIKIIEGITNKAINMYQSYAAAASGDFKFQIDYSNFKQQIHNTFHPIQTEINRQYNNLQLKKDTLASEQQRLLLGGTATNSPYGRYL